jgi:hypothetical protein
MSELSDEDLLEVIRTVWQERDPVPEGMLPRLQASAALAASDADLDLELMLLVERTSELTGTRGGSATAYTMRFAHEGVDLLVRVAHDPDGSRIDCWVVPPSPLTVHVLLGAEPGAAPFGAMEVDSAGRFEVVDLPAGLLRLRLEPHDGSPAFVTPAFEI